MANNTYIVIQSFMVDKLKLQGNELIVYAVIYGFSQDGESEFMGTARYLANWAGVSRKATILDILKKLTNAGLIKKEDVVINGVKRVYYAANLDLLGGDTESVSGDTETAPGDTETVSQNINNNINNNNINNNTQDYSNTLESVVCNNTHARAHEPPTPKLEDVLAYAKQQNEFAGVGGYKITKYMATRFYDYYTATGWRNKNNVPIVDWRAQLRLWASDVRHQEKPEKLDKPVKLW